MIVETNEWATAEHANAYLERALAWAPESRGSEFRDV